MEEDRTGRGIKQISAQRKLTETLHFESGAEKRLRFCYNKIMKKTIFDNKILIVDDNLELRAMLKTFLKKEGYENLSFAVDCRGAEQALSAEKPDFIILDVNLPDGDGFSLMRRIKGQALYRDIPVLFLSARDKDADRLLGLGLGADDYMVKPFLPKELLLRMSAILKRSYSYTEEQLQKGSASEGRLSGAIGRGGRSGRESAGGPFRSLEEKELSFQNPELNRTGMEYGYFTEEAEPERELHLGTHTVDFEAGIVRSEAKEEKLTVKELKILETLSRSRGRIVTFDNLCKAVWNAQYYTYENTVMVHIRRLREKIEDDPSRPKWLVTARGIGYKLL